MEPRPERPERPAAPPPAPRPGWAPWTAPAALVTGLFGALVGALIIGIFAGAAGADGGDTPPAVTIASTIVQDAALVLSAVFFAARWRFPRSADFGLKLPRLGLAVGTLLAGWAAYFAFSGVWSAIIGGGPEDNLPQELGADDSTIALVVVMALTCVIAPIAEEVFFRGYFFTAVSNWKGWRVGAVITGVVFGLIHVGSAPAVYLVPLGVFGLVLCVIYKRTGSLLPCIALHALNNALAFGVTQDWTWQVPVLMVGANAIIAAVIWPLARRRAAAPAAR